MSDEQERQDDEMTHDPQRQEQTASAAFLRNVCFQGFSKQAVDLFLCLIHAVLPDGLAHPVTFSF